MSKAKDLLLKDLVQLMKAKKVFFDGGNAKIQLDRKNMNFITIHLKPTIGAFENVKVTFTLTYKDDGYGNQKPQCKCKTKVFHPNISASDESVCYNFFGSEWKQAYRLKEIINALLFFLNHPNHESPLNSDCKMKDENAFRDCVQNAAKGLKVRGKKYDLCYDG